METKSPYKHGLTPEQLYEMEQDMRASGHQWPFKVVKTDEDHFVMMELKEWLLRSNMVKAQLNGSTTTLNKNEAKRFGGE